ncbi:phosphoenolpyruvate synthase [Marivirga arenosa]|uniref:Phosphoenolpyruvate synthase n=1 Tax=Marivirga arenosa TaxID=3059076 RepID=A0AA51N914_9BACT|nr:phosphoenolpyruvate synthase [Marivirga sp. ABR2-2]WMN06735.1 phosphoenolpyruvate synthase [Marivirga sp. ABR2-2]
MNQFIYPFKELSLSDLGRVGGKNASLGELYKELVSKGINVPDGFAISAEAYWDVLDSNNIRDKLKSTLSELDTKGFKNLAEIGEKCRKLLGKAKLPTDLINQIIEAYQSLKSNYPDSLQLAVRSSATAEDLPEASFAGQQESYLNIESEQELLAACNACYASLFTNRAIKYREDNGFNHMDVALSIGVQKMVRSDLGSAGVCFSLDTETGFDKVVNITGAWGLGENVVKGTVSPDDFCLYKPAIKAGKKAILFKHLGQKEKTMTYAAKDENKKFTYKTKTINLKTAKEKQKQYVLTDTELEKLAKWTIQIEEHYQKPMDIEWAKDGINQQLYIVQARAETVHSLRSKFQFFDYKLKSKSKIIVEGRNVGGKIAAGKAKILQSPAEIDKLNEGEILVTNLTNPDWDPILKRAAAIVTNTGGRTSHAAIVARETGAVAVVGAHGATKLIKDGQEITVSCADGKKGTIYEGKLDWESTEIDTREIKLPQTEVMFILADPDQAFKLSFLPNNGVGLMRLEFVINNSIKVHPMALAHFKNLKDKKAKAEIEELTFAYPNKEDYFTEKLSQAVGTIAAAFYPKDVIVRMSDFKTNEYANLLGGKEFETEEQNPMIGWRGASRYYSEGYKDGFKLECESMRIVREEMGFTNVKLMIPFCRTLDEAKKVVDIMAKYGLKRGVNGLELYMMVEIPSNVILAEKFAEYFDGFSIGSNDLTQLTLGIDRDSEALQSMFDAENEAVKKLIKEAITSAKNTGTKIGLCGQAASDSSDFTYFLVKNGIDSISFNPDALIKGIKSINHAESMINQQIDAI